MDKPPMTDKVHPVVEAAAKAIWEANNGSWEFASPEGQAACCHEAKAAAKVLLSMEPTEGMKKALLTGFAYKPYTGKEGPGYWDGLAQWDDERAKSAFTAMTSRAREEMGV